MSWMDKECGDCEAFRRARMNSSAGTCHKGRPVPIMVGMTKDPISGKPIPLVRSFWADVADTTHACGEFEQRTGLAAIDMSRLAQMPVEGEG